jgi:hypothetical protein
MLSLQPELHQKPPKPPNPSAKKSVNIQLYWKTLVEVPTKFVTPFRIPDSVWLRRQNARIRMSEHHHDSGKSQYS